MATRKGGGLVHEQCAFAIFAQSYGRNWVMAV